MAVELPNPAKVICRDPKGREVASVWIWNARKANGATGENADLIRWTDAEAAARNEEPVQLRERGRYIYQIKGRDGAEVADLALQEAPGVTRSPASDQEGFIEPGDQCGVLPLVLLRGTELVAQAAVEVRSIKLEYRKHYRDMLGYIAQKCAGLLLDSRANTRLRLSSAWRDNPTVMEQQLEFLRHTLESAGFDGAVNEVLRNPHRCLEDDRQEQSISRPFKAGKDFARQIVRAGNRVALPEAHPLRTLHPALTTLPSRIHVIRRTDFLDTAENRFVKMVLEEFRDFLVEVGGLIGRVPADRDKPENIRLLREVGRLRGRLDALLGRGFLPDVSRPEVLPLGSPVLQRKAGYRELLHAWLQFHVGAQLEWEGGGEVWHGGARNVATLYEYWLFFQLEELFREKFNCEEPLHAVLLETDRGLPRLKLQRGVELRTPIGGVWSQVARRPLKAEFHFNHKFSRNIDHRKGGSWTRGVQPDYTLSIWPAEFETPEEAEKSEVLVHVHFDAKYRVENAQSLFGRSEDDEELISDRSESSAAKPTSAKYADLLKMHAYRDAIRRTAGAYVLYPGNPGPPNRFVEFEGFHEVLPGLGAFAIRPSGNGNADGMASLSSFLDEVIEHLSNRTTARERTTYHLGEAYAVEEAPVPYGDLVLNERDDFSTTNRALPPAEHHVVVAWYDSDAQLKWTETTGQVLVRLGDRPGTWHVPPEFASARHVLLHTHNGVVRPGLLRLKDGFPGYKIFSTQDVINLGYPATPSGEIYAIFEVVPDPAYDEQLWDAGKLWHAQSTFDLRTAYRPKPHNRRSADPRVLSLRELLTARKSV